MANMNDTETLLREGIEDVRQGNRAAARDKFERVVEMDENSEKGWFWLASVVDTDEEKRICLSNVLHINPNNDRARRAMDAMGAQAKTKAGREEVIPGVSRRQFTLILGGGLLVVIVLIGIVVAIAANNAATTARLSVEGTGTQAAFVSTGTAFVEQATGTSVAGTATQLAIATPTITPSPTSNRPTLPPEFTATPLPTAAPTQASLALPEGVTGVLSAWGGRDALSNDFLAVGYYNFNASFTFNRIGNELGRNVSLDPNSAGRIVYTRYDDVLFGSIIEIVNLNGTQQEALSGRYQDQELILNPQMPSFSRDGLSVLFVGTSEGSTPQVFRLSLVDNTLTNLTNDTAEWSYPRFSPDGRRIVAVRNEVATGTGVDLALIDVATNSKLLLTNDQNTFIETQPRWTSDGVQVYYAAAAGNDRENNDVYIRVADGTGAPSPLLQDPANDQFPVLSPNGQFIAFASDRDGDNEIYILEIQQQLLSQLTVNQGEDDFPGDWAG